MSDGFGDDDFLTLIEDSSDDEDESKVAPPPPPPKPPSDPMQTLPPWMSAFPTQNTPPLVQLHNEIVEYTNLMAPTEDEVNRLEAVVTDVADIVTDCFAGRRYTKLFGSLATGLLLPSSDIDLCCLLHEVAAETDSVKEASPLRVFAAKLRQVWGKELTYMEVLEHTRIPLVKFTRVNKDAEGIMRTINVDVSFDVANGPQAAHLMRYYLSTMPVLRPLTLVLKSYLATRNLNSPYHGGVGSFAVQLMLISFLQQRHREDASTSRVETGNLGSMLLDFFELYGLNFNYITTGLTVVNDGMYFPKGHPGMKEDYFNPTRPMMLGIENPMEPGMDVGKSSYRVGLVRKAFEISYKTLLARLTPPYLQSISILSTIIPIRDWMELRVDTYGQGMKRDVLKRWDYVKAKPEASVNGNVNGKREREEEDVGVVPDPSDHGSDMVMSDDEEGELNGDGDDEVEVVKPPPAPPAAAATAAAATAAAATAAPLRKLVLSDKSYFVFMCNGETHHECLRRMLFAAPGDKDKVTTGSLLFLYDYSSSEMTGPFEASSDSGKEIVKGAFGGKFKFQTRVKYLNNGRAGVKNKGKMRESMTATVTKASFNSEVLGQAANYRKVPSKLTTDEGKKLMGLLQKMGWSAELLGLELE